MPLNGRVGFDSLLAEDSKMRVAGERSRTWRLGWLVIVMMMSVSGLAAPKKAVEDPAKEAAKAAFTAGNRHYQLSEYTQALEKFKDAFRIFPEPSILYNIGQCQRQLGQKEDAVRSYKSFLRNAGETPMREEVQSTIAKLEMEIAEDRAKAAEAEAQRIKLEAAERAAKDAQASVNVQAPASSEPRAKPIYKRAWFWGVVVGAVVVVGVGVGLGVGLAPAKIQYPTTNAPDGTIRF